jgi:hypothetical protein
MGAPDTKFKNLNKSLPDNRIDELEGLPDTPIKELGVLDTGSMAWTRSCSKKINDLEACWLSSPTGWT